MASGKRILRGATLGDRMNPHLKLLDYFSDGTPIVKLDNHPGYIFERLDRTLEVVLFNENVIYTASEESQVSVTGFVDSLKFAEELRVWLICGVEPERWGDGKHDEGNGDVACGYIMLAILLCIVAAAVGLLWRWGLGG